MVRVSVLGEKKEIQMHGVTVGEQILRKLGLSANSTIILKNGKPIAEDAQIDDEDAIVVMKSFSGG